MSWNWLVITSVSVAEILLVSKFRMVSSQLDSFVSCTFELLADIVWLSQGSDGFAGLFLLYSGPFNTASLLDRVIEGSLLRLFPRFQFKK